MDKQFNVIDLFSGCGGLSYGFQQAEYRISVALDNWDFALKTLKYNHSGVDIICDSISNVNPLNIKNEYNIDVIIGGPPCQGFSIAGKRIINDERNKLYKEFVKYVAVIRPKIFLMENVPNLASMGNGVILESILSDFNKIGYKLNWKILKASDYGVPQNRRRFFLIGTQNKIFDFNALSIYKTKEITSKEAISDLPEGDIKPEDGYPIHPLSEYQVEMRKESLGIYNHITTKHTEKTISIIKMVPDGVITKIYRYIFKKREMLILHGQG
ncbi:MAG: DNA cytosine methyltransferase [Candidatus Marinimicrobia bacterium]|nr:DNA cytosine methyltransferase [Candidatus Neomarinimicrobiota bacterium]